MPRPTGLTSPRFKQSPTLKAVRKGQRTLKRGDKGAAVGLLQEALVAQGFLVPAFDAETEAAVWALQKAQGIGVDGIVGPTTLRLLDAKDGAWLAAGTRGGDGVDQAAAERVYTVIDRDARIRSGPPNFKWNGRSRVPVHTRVRIRKIDGKHAHVVGLTGKDYKWTARSNLATYYKDSGILAKVPLSPDIHLQIQPAWPKLRRSLARTYNRLGGLIQPLANETKIDVAAVLAVWQIESAGRRHTPGHAIIRFENHLLFRRWGEQDKRLYSRHFQHGGHNRVAGKPWKSHKYRKSKSARFRPFHGKQNLEYDVLELGIKLAGEKTGLQCISIGGPQILVSNHRLIGYRRPKSMNDAFQDDERAHLLGFFDYCQHHGKRGSLISRLRTKDWTGFATGYNGPGQADRYGKLIGAAYDEGTRLFSG